MAIYLVYILVWKALKNETINPFSLTRLLGVCVLILIVCKRDCKQKPRIQSPRLRLCSLIEQNNSTPMLLSIPRRTELIRSSIITQ